MKRKKTYSNISGKEMKECVEDIEESMQTIDNNIFADPALIEAMNMLRRLDTSERRLFIVYSELDCSIIKTANYFKVDRRTISTRIKEIKTKMNNECIGSDTEHDLSDSYTVDSVAVQDNQ